MTAEFLIVVIELIKLVFIGGIFAAILIVARNIHGNFQNVRELKIEVVDELESIRKKVVDIEDRLVQIDRDIVEGNHNNH